MFFGSILHRMIFRELLRIFLLSLFGITGILLMAGIIAEASQQGLGPKQIIAIIPLLLPSTLPYTIPATTLFATCFVYGRLSADNEILAVRAGGISMTKVLWPGMILGLVTSGVTLGLYHTVIPYTHHILRSMFINDAEGVLYNMLRTNQQINYGRLDYAIFVKGVQGRRLLSPVFKRRDTKLETDVVAVAREAELRVDLNNKVILVQMKFGEVWSRNGTTAEFVDRLFDVPLPDDVGKQSFRRPRDMTWEELEEFNAMEIQERDQCRAEIDHLESVARHGILDESQNSQLNASRHKMRSAEGRMRAILVEKHMRPALALGCLFFVLVGCPVGIWFSKGDYLSSFITCFLPIVFLYYPFILCSTTMVKDTNKGISEWIIWGPDLLMASLGTVLFRRLLRN